MGEMLRSNGKRQFFSDIFHSLFSEHVHIRHLGTSLSMFTASVLVEGLKALSVERAAPRQLVVGVPSESDVSRALGRLHMFIVQSNLLSTVEKQVTLLRWHTVCLHMVVDLNRLSQAIFREHKIKQRIIGGPKSSPFDARSWVHSARARCGLLHASSINSILQTLPTAQLQGIHIPISAFTAAIIYCAFLLGGVSNIGLPSIQSWDSVVLIDLDMDPKNIIGDLDSDVRHFLSGGAQGQEKGINLLYDLSLFSRTLKNLDQLWGVSNEMNRVLEELSSHCA
jgi:hypothetical protein